MDKKSDYRFRHIVTELSDCEDAIEELLNGVTDDGQPLSDDELRAARRLIASCLNVVNLVSDSANLALNFEEVEQSIDRVLHAANSALLEARYDERDARILLANAKP